MIVHITKKEQVSWVNIQPSKDLIEELVNAPVYELMGIATEEGEDFMGLRVGTTVELPMQPSYKVIRITVNISQGTSQVTIHLTRYDEDLGVDDLVIKQLDLDVFYNTGWSISTYPPFKEDLADKMYSSIEYLYLKGKISDYNELEEYMTMLAIFRNQF